MRMVMMGVMGGRLSRWFVPNCVSKPSLVLPWGVAITLEFAVREDVLVARKVGNGRTQH